MWISWVFLGAQPSRVLMRQNSNAGDIGVIAMLGKENETANVWKFGEAIVAQKSDFGNYVAIGYSEVETDS